jgi:hypothetical protein
MAKILLNIPDELKEALEDRIDGIFAPRNTSVTHAIRSALYFIIQQNNMDFGNLIVWGHTAEVSFKGYSNLFDKYKEEGYIPDTIPRGTGHHRAFYNVMVKFYDGEIDEKEFKAFIKELEEEIRTMKYAPEMAGYKPPELFEKMREFVQEKHEGNKK